MARSAFVDRPGTGLAGRPCRCLFFASTQAGTPDRWCRRSDTTALPPNPAGPTRPRKRGTAAARCSADGCSAAGQRPGFCGVQTRIGATEHCQPFSYRHIGCSQPVEHADHRFVHAIAHDFGASRPARSHNQVSRCEGRGLRTVPRDAGCGRTDRCCHRNPPASKRTRRVPLDRARICCANHIDKPFGPCRGNRLGSPAVTTDRASRKRCNRSYEAAGCRPWSKTVHWHLCPPPIRVRIRLLALD